MDGILGPAAEQVRRQQRKKIVLSITVAFAVVIAGVVTFIWPSEEDRLIESVKNVAREGAFDPDAFKFKTMSVNKSGFTIVVCGEMNGKNQLGAYTGYQPFVFNAPKRGELNMVTPQEYQGWCSR